MIIDETRETRSIEQRVANEPEVDVEIEVRSVNSDGARELADELADAIHKVLQE